ncbi:hypothetical protein J6590_087339 [Homalodisca vitripennis]|nr:hypothetical protein J6590_087339 [Homalodisca vitripennis]
MELASKKSMQMDTRIKSAVLTSVNCNQSSASMGDNNKTHNPDMQAIEEKLNLILSKITRMESDSASLKSDINSIKEDNKKFTAEINITLEFYSEKLVKLERNVGHTEGKVKIQSENIDLLKSENISLRRELFSLKKKLNANSHYLKSNFLEILKM